MSPSPNQSDDQTSQAKSEEVELTYRLDAARSTGADGVWAELSSAQSLASAQADKANHQIIRDIYYDTATMELFRGQIYLRLRLSAGQAKFTLKGPSPTLSAGLKKRLEVEGPVSTATWQSIVVSVTQLNHNLGTMIGRITPDYDGIKTLAHVDPQEDGLGLTQTVFGGILKPFQDRLCERITRNVMLGLNQPAEIALDTVAYKAGMQTVLHREVEVEAGPQTPSDVLVNYGDRLAGDYHMRHFDISKVAMGLLIEKKADEEPVLFQGMIVNTEVGLFLNEAFYKWAEQAAKNLRG